MMPLADLESPEREATLERKMIRQMCFPKMATASSTSRALVEYVPAISPIKRGSLALLSVNLGWSWWLFLNNRIWCKWHLWMPHSLVSWNAPTWDSLLQNHLLCSEKHKPPRRHLSQSTLDSLSQAESGSRRSIPNIFFRSELLSVTRAPSQQVKKPGFERWPLWAQEGWPGRRSSRAKEQTLAHGGKGPSPQPSQSHALWALWDFQLTVTPTQLGCFKVHKTSKHFSLSQNVWLISANGPFSQPTTLRQSTCRST